MHLPLERTEIHKSWLLRRGNKLEDQEKKPSEQGEEPTTNQPVYDSENPEFEPEPHWWETSVLITTSSLDCKKQGFDRVKS